MAQVANQYYNMIVTSTAIRQIDKNECSISTGPQSYQQDYQASTTQNEDINSSDDNVRVEISGEYMLQITARVRELSSLGEDVHPTWKCNLN